MSAPNPPHRKWFENPPQHATAPKNRPSSTIDCSHCDRWWTGLGSAHCGACHETFTGVDAFDIHRRGGKCTHPVEIRNKKNGDRLLISANKPWIGWSRPGTWTGPDD